MSDCGLPGFLFLDVVRRGRPGLLLWLERGAQGQGLYWAVSSAALLGEPRRSLRQGHPLFQVYVEQHQAKEV